VNNGHSLSLFKTLNAIFFNCVAVNTTTSCNSLPFIASLQLLDMASKDSNLPEEEQIQPRNFYIFGQGISFSMSPTIHNASFRFYNLPYTYTIHEAATVDELAPLISSPNFGGSSITTPHKVEIMKFCSSISEHAQNCGAVNTLIRDELSSSANGNVIRGDNTDWKGLVGVLEQRQKNFQTRN
jgi:shikimate 5-dehydrogenase